MFSDLLLDELKASIEGEGVDRWTWLLLGSILTRPGDGRPVNYIMNNNLPYCVDNDAAFVEPVTENWLRRKDVHFHTILFCFDTFLSPSVMNHFCSLDAFEILSAWSKNLIKREGMYSSLFNDSEVRLGSILGLEATLNLEAIELQIQEVIEALTAIYFALRNKLTLAHLIGGSH